MKQVSDNFYRLACAALIAQLWDAKRDIVAFAAFPDLVAGFRVDVAEIEAELLAIGLVKDGALYEAV